MGNAVYRTNPLLEVEMAFWDSWFKPKCEQCEAKVDEVFEIEDKESTFQVCAACKQKYEEKAAKEKAELEERWRVEEEMRKRMEGLSSFGGARRNNED